MLHLSPPQYAGHAWRIGTATPRARTRLSVRKSTATVSWPVIWHKRCAPRPVVDDWATSTTFRPFYVDTPQGSIRALGTRFIVELSQNPNHTL